MATVALNAAIMDMCHAGHINLLEQMRARADISVVVLHTDESCWRIKHKVPVQNITQRIRNLEITGLVDHIMVTDQDDPGEKFEVVAKLYEGHEITYIRGTDAFDFPGKPTLERLGIPIVWIPYTQGVSSSMLREMAR